MIQKSRKDSFEAFIASRGSFLFVQFLELPCDVEVIIVMIEKNIFGFLIIKFMSIDVLNLNYPHLL